MQQQPKSPLPEGIPTVPQTFSNDLPDFDLFFFVLYSYCSSSYFTCLFPNFNVIQKRLNSSRILQTWVTFPDSSHFFTVKSILCQLPSHIRYSVEMHSSAFNQFMLVRIHFFTLVPSFIWRISKEPVFNST